MKRSSRRVISILAAAALTVCAAPQTLPLSLQQPVLTAGAAGSEGYFEYELSEDGSGVVLTKWTGVSAEVTVPDELGGLPVTEIGTYTFSEKPALLNVTLPDTVRVIRGGAFMRSENLKKVELSEALETIGSNAFNGCKSLTSIDIPFGVRSIEGLAFSGCEELTEVSIPETVEVFGETVFRGTRWLDTKKEEGLVIVNGNLLDGTAASGVVTVPDGVIRICGQAFSQRMELTDVIIPGSVASIDVDAFVRCKGLKSVSLNEGLKTISSRAFSECSSLTEIIIPDSVTEIGTEAFYDCSKLASVHLPAGLKEITGGSQKGVFQSCAIKEIDIPEGVSSIGGLAFALCPQLKKVIIRGSDTAVARSAFLSCPSDMTVCGYAYSPAEQFAVINSYSFEELAAGFSTVSLSLADDLGLNFYAGGLSAGNKDDYKVRFRGRCEENGKDVSFTERNGRLCATANVTAVNMDEKITAELYKKTADGWVKTDTATYSVNDYLENAEPEQGWSTAKAGAFDKLVDTVKLYGKVSYAYFNTPDDMPAVTDYKDEILDSEKAYNPYKRVDIETGDTGYDTEGRDRVSLTLDSRLSMRMYLDGLTEGEEGVIYKVNSALDEDTLVFSESSKYGAYFEITGISPLNMDVRRSVGYFVYDYDFSPLTWVWRVKNYGHAEARDNTMADMLFEYYRNAKAFAEAE